MSGRPDQSKTMLRHMVRGLIEVLRGVFSDDEIRQIVNEMLDSPKVEIRE